MLPGQLAADAYEASQRQPGDYEAQVSQRPVAIHGLEHLGGDGSRRHYVPATAPAGYSRRPGRANS